MFRSRSFLIALLLVISTGIPQTQAAYTADVLLEAAYEENLAEGEEGSLNGNYTISVESEEEVYWEQDDGCKFLLLITTADPLVTDEYETVHEWEQCLNSGDSDLISDDTGYNSSISIGGNAMEFLSVEGDYWVYFQPLNTNTDELTLPAVSMPFTITKDHLDEPFTDMDTHWSKNYVNALATLGDVSGYSDETFRPDQPITRAEFLTIVFNALSDPAHDFGGDCEAAFTVDESIFETPTFSDVTEAHWVYDTVQWAAALDTISGYQYDNDVFYPNNLITRAEALSMLWKVYMVCDTHNLDSWYDDEEYYAQFLETGDAFAADLPLEFTDVTPNWQRLFVYLSSRHGLVNGYETEEGEMEFRPDQNITRGEAAKIAWKMRTNPHHTEVFE